MKLIDDIRENQVDYLKSINIPIIDFKVIYNSSKSITYYIDIEVSNEKVHIIIGYNWDFENVGIQYYFKDKFVSDKSKEIYNTNDLHEFVTRSILKNIYK